MTMVLGKLLNRALDELVHPEIHLFHRAQPAFLVCGYVGLASAILLGMVLVIDQGLSPWVMAAVILAAVLAFLGLAMATKIITGEEQLIYYHHQIAVTVASAFLLWLLRQPVLPYLDVTLLGVGVFLVCGRAGCLMVGCCHGRPHRWGVCYRQEHAEVGFTPYLVGVRLFPVQAVESLWVLGTVLVGSALVLIGRPPGEALAWYVITYNIGRFCFEFIRGDPARPYRWGFSEAQWTSLLLMCTVVWIELAGALPFHLWHVGAAAGVACAMVAVALGRRFRRTARHRLLHPRHVREVAEIIGLASNPAIGKELGPSRVPQNSARAAIDIGCTFLGVQISAGRIESVQGRIDHYTLSSRNGAMSEKTARTLADLIVQLGHPFHSSELVTQTQGVFHLLVRPLTAGSQK